VEDASSQHRSLDAIPEEVMEVPVVAKTEAGTSQLVAPARPTRQM
jgi:hypothetical protein